MNCPVAYFSPLTWMVPVRPVRMTLAMISLSALTQLDGASGGRSPSCPCPSRPWHAEQAAAPR